MQMQLCQGPGCKAAGEYVHVADWKVGISSKGEYSDEAVTASLVSRYQRNIKPPFQVIFPIHNGQST